ncbi:MAG: hypothetical protein WC378_04470 [Opitutaceae bacterium]|jgi:hypothetical protein
MRILTQAPVGSPQPVITKEIGGVRVTYAGTLTSAHDITLPDPVARIAPDADGTAECGPSFPRGKIASYAAEGGALTLLSFDDTTEVARRFCPSGMPDLAQLSLPVLQKAASFAPDDMPSLVVLSLPVLEEVGYFGPTGMPALTSLDTPLLCRAGAFAPSDMALLVALSAGALTYAETVAPADMPLLPSLLFPAMTGCGTFAPRNMDLLALLSADVLANLSGDLALIGLPALASAIFTAVQTVGGSVRIIGCSALPSFSLPNATSIGGLKISDASALATVSTPLVETVAGDMEVSEIPLLGALSFPALGSLDGHITITAAPALASFSIPLCTSTAGDMVIHAANLTTVGISSLISIGSGEKIDLSGCALSQASVDQVLEQVALMDGTNGSGLFGEGKTLDLSGGTNSVPSEIGMVDMAIISARGAIIITN